MDGRAPPRSWHDPRARTRAWDHPRATSSLARHNRDESFGSAEAHSSESPRSSTVRTRLNALNTHTALTLYLLIVFVIAARTVVLTLIKVQLNKTKTENNHFCLTGKMARYVAEAVTTHAPPAKHMFFRLELCAGLMNRAAVLRCTVTDRGYSRRGVVGKADRSRYRQEHMRDETTERLSIRSFTALAKLVGNE